MLALLVGAALAAVPVRVATWNIETIGSPGSVEFEAAVDVASRLSAEVLCINEVASAADAALVPTFAAAVGYGYSAVAASGAFGSDRTACFSDYPFVSTTWTSAALSEDSAANDLTRLYLAVEVAVPGAAEPLVVIANHWKSGSANSDELRRVADAQRGADLLDRYVGLPVLFLGDLNAQVTDGVQYPAAFTSLPTGLPSSYRLAVDLSTQMGSGGIVNDPFLPLAPYVSVVEATQFDGDLSTREVSGRRIDYIFASPELSDSAVGEVYNCAQEGLPSLLAYAGSALAPELCALASDHLPVVVEVALEEANLAPVADAGGPYAGTTRKNTVLSAARSSDADGSIVSYAWDFGDGTTATGVSPRKRWTRVGTYTLTLVVTDDQGATHTVTTTATIKSK
jgi:endonuclease/exonuclease/phosphatase family metal-dependent hydrolase